VGAELFHEDRETNGQTDRTKLIVALRYYANASTTTQIKAVNCTRMRIFM